MDDHTMNETIRQWREFSQRLTTRRRGVVVTLALYPAVVCVAVITMTAIIGTDTVWRDAIGIGAIALVATVCALPPARRSRHQHRWFTFAAELCGGLSNGESLSGAARSGGVTMQEAGVLDRALQEGVSPAGALAGAACPAPIVEAITAATDRSDLVRRLGSSITAYQEEVFVRLERLERIGQPLTVGVAGSLVVWMVMRVVVPELITRFSYLGTV